jgi:hypothetical protein
MESLNQFDRAALANFYAGENSASNPSSDLEEEAARKLRLENDITEEDMNLRRHLIHTLSIVSIAWLLFTVAIISSLVWGCGELASSVAIAFITTSLATVVGLWAVGLRYFFYKIGH